MTVEIINARIDQLNEEVQEIGMKLLMGVSSRNEFALLKDMENRLYDELNFLTYQKKKVLINA